MCIERLGKIMVHLSLIAERQYKTSMHAFGEGGRGRLGLVSLFFRDCKPEANLREVSILIRLPAFLSYHS